MAKSNGKRVRRRIWIGLAILAIAGIGFTVARPKAKTEDEKGKIKTSKAEVADVQVRVTEVGSVEPQVKVDVKSVLSGKVVELLVREGDRGEARPGARAGRADVNQARDLAQVKNAVAEADIALCGGEGPRTSATAACSDRACSRPRPASRARPRYRQAKASYDSAMDKYRIVQESGVPIASVAAGSRSG
jgi:multidrug efflux pump subunit AcrA (membrane-fusion protein)